MKLVEVKVRFTGIYEMGIGFISDAKMNQWYSALKDIDSPFWKYHCDEDCRANYLVCVGGGGLIHPMDGVHLFIKEFGHSYTWVDGKQIETHDSADSLIDLMKVIAEKCGGEAVVDTYRIVDTY